MRTLGVVLIMFFLAVMTVLIVLDVKFDQNCGGYLKRSADSNSIEMAKGELLKGIKYLEQNGDTLGYTSIIYRTPDEDVGFWYHNLKSAYKQLDEITATTTELEKTNVLMKLRETLLDNMGTKGDSLTCPDGISKYPSNTLWFIITLFSIICLFGGVIIVLFSLDD
jgi:hypothetical protein